MTENIIELKNITKRFTGITANDNISLSIKKGEIFALLGENGAGKSVLMSIVFGMYEPDEGELYIKGKKVTEFSPKKATENNIGMVHQHFKLVENFTVTENITLGMETIKQKGLFKFVDLDTMNKKIAELSKNYKLEVDPEAKIQDLNVATRQRVEILKMLYRDAEILIFDEPSSVLTPQEIEALLQIIKDLRDDGKTIILVTHKLEEIKKVADRFAVLNQGHLVDIREVKDTSTREMAHLMVGRDIVFESEKHKSEFGKQVLNVSHIDVYDVNKIKKVDSVSFSIREGEIFAIAGVSDNGQNEIADAIYGMLDIKNGSIELKDKDISGLSIRDRINAGIAYIPQDRQEVGMCLDFTLAENLAMKNYYKKPYCIKNIINMDLMNKEAKEIISRYDIRSNRDEHSIVRSMSGGNQQKAIIAREILQDTSLLIFVQPTRGLDIGAIENTRNYILEQRDKKKAILLISLELDEVMALADTIGVIYNGKINKIAKVEDLSRNEIGKYMMGVEE